MFAFLTPITQVELSAELTASQKSILAYGTTYASLVSLIYQMLAMCGATLYMVCRNPERGQKAVKSVQEKTGNANVHLRLCDGQ